MTIIVKILIVIGCIALFIGTYLLNRRTKVPENLDIELPDKCLHCGNTACGAKKNALDEMKMNQIIDQCKENDNNEPGK